MSRHRPERCCECDGLLPGNHQGWCLVGNPPKMPDFVTLAKENPMLGAIDEYSRTPLGHCDECGGLLPAHKAYCREPNRAARRRLNQPMTRCEVLAAIDRVAQEYARNRDHDSDLIANAFFKLAEALR